MQFRQRAASEDDKKRENAAKISCSSRDRARPREGEGEGGRGRIFSLSPLVRPFLSSSHSVNDSGGSRMMALLARASERMDGNGINGRKDGRRNEVREKE